MIERLQQNILTELPAWEAHKRMAPPHREPLGPMPAAVRQSAVCVLVYYKNQEPHTVLIQRTADGRTHSGQISFPGGSLDKTDFSYIYCALRECEEEIGLGKHQLHVLGSMSNLYIPPSNFLVKPVVCFCDEPDIFKPSPLEVAQIIEVPLNVLFNDQNKQTKNIALSYQPERTITTPIYQYQQHTIWGATAMMLAEFEEIYKRSL